MGRRAHTHTGGYKWTWSALKAQQQQHIIPRGRDVTGSQQSAPLYLH